MDKIEQYRQFIQDLLNHYSQDDELVKMGVFKEDIILGLHPPYKRKYTDYGVV